MLEELNVHNFALMERVNVRFSPGLNVLSGETGAGKSILIGALGLLLGVKTDTSVIRTGCDETLVSGMINIKHNQEASDWIKTRGIKLEAGTIILRRVVRKSGRGSIYIQSIPVTRSDIAELTSLLFDIHGQHEHQSLLQLENHRKVLDRFGDTEKMALDFHNNFNKLSALKQSYSRLLKSEREQLRQIDMLKHAVKEIEGANLKVGEEEALEKEHKVLSNYEKLYQLLEEVYTNVSESRGGALVSLKTARHNMEEIIEIDASLSQLHNQLQDAFYEIEDFNQNIRNIRSNINFSPERLSIVEDRLANIRMLKKKYGNSIKEVLLYHDQCQQQLENINNWEQDKEKLKNEIAQREKEIIKLANELSEKRKQAAIMLQKKIETDLKQLGMPKVRFQVVVKDKTDKNNKAVLSSYGKDHIEFVISPNLGEPFKRLRSIASGGELSRVMLAIKSALAESDHINTLIFDEIDAGIGGEIGLAVGQRLKSLSAFKQVLCITHLATIAVRADLNIKVDKVIKDGRTITCISKISGEKKKEEIARMLAGDKTAQASLTHAEELIAKYSS